MATTAATTTSPVQASRNGRGLNVITPGYTGKDAQNHPFGIDNSYQVYDTDGSYNNAYIGMTTANAKALGETFASGSRDGSIYFNADADYDFNPSDGVSAGQFDFVALAIHEIGHALGFVSGVDSYDQLGGPNGNAYGYDCGGFQCQDWPANDDWFGTTLDLFRYSRDPGHLVSASNAPTLTWAPGIESYYSADGGAHNLGNFSTGGYNGDGQQAGHWKAPVAAPFCSGFLGIMNPIFCQGYGGTVSELDFAALDAIGYNFNFGADGPKGFSTANIYRQFGAAQDPDSAVPEPTTWALVIGALGTMGAVTRRRRTVRAAP